MTGDQWLKVWLGLFVVTGLIVAVQTGWLKARKVQPNGFRWKQFRFEAIMAVVTLAFGFLVLGNLTKWLTAHQWITFKHDNAAWWVILLEYAAYFITFDTWFYWLHRWMHNEPYYRWIHKLHHRSTAPNLLTTLSVHPLESLINGGWMIIFITVFSVHDASMAFIGITNQIMGLYVHSGYELFPRWWNKSWVTKWFITATFHDQHHKYFTANFGGYTTVWDRICGTMRPKFEKDYLAIKDRGKAIADSSETAAA